jgi:hypothetical protein
MNRSQAQLIRTQLAEISSVMAAPAHGSDPVLWAAARILEAADLLLQAHLAGGPAATGDHVRQALLEAVTNCRAATVATTSAIRADVRPA